MIEYEVSFKHPHNIGIDIKGNFHRGFMIGIIVGYWIGMITVMVTAIVFQVMK